MFARLFGCSSKENVNAKKSTIKLAVFDYIDTLGTKTGRSYKLNPGVIELIDELLKNGTEVMIFSGVSFISRKYHPCVDTDYEIAQTLAGKLTKDLPDDKFIMIKISDARYHQLRRGQAKANKLNELINERSLSPEEVLFMDDCLEDINVVKKRVGCKTVLAEKRAFTNDDVTTSFYMHVKELATSGGGRLQNFILPGR